MAEPVAYGDDALRVPDRVDDAAADQSGFGMPSMVTMPSLMVTTNLSGSHRNVSRIRSWVT